jgi:polysaccharide export outer membrane protein
MRSHVVAPAWRRAAVAFLILGFLSACSPGGDFAGVQVSSDPQSAGGLGPPAIGGGGKQAEAANYRIGANDILDVAVYGVPDLNRTVQVDGRGDVVLPLISIVKAAGRTPRDLEADIAKRLGDKYLRSPQVTVFVKEAYGQRVTVDGAVKLPGVVQAKGEMTLLAAIALAQGFTDVADTGAVLVFRQTQQGRTAARFDANAIRSGAAQDPQIFGGDTIVVDESGAKAAFKAVRDSLPAAGVFLRMFI